MDEENLGKYLVNFLAKGWMKKTLGRYLVNFFAKGGWIERG